MPINENELTKEILAKAMKCETAEDLIALAKAEGIDLTKEEAEAYLAERDDVELDDTALQQVAGGTSSVADASQVRIQSFHCGALGLNWFPVQVVQGNAPAVAAAVKRTIVW